MKEILGFDPRRGKVANLWNAPRKADTTTSLFRKITHRDLANHEVLNAPGSEKMREAQLLCLEGKTCKSCITSSVTPLVHVSLGRVGKSTNNINGSLAML